MSTVRLDQFDHSKVKRQRSRFTQIVWLLTQCAFFDTAFPWPYSIKRFLLRRFGGDVGKGVVLRSRIYIHSPWMLDIGNHCWIGDGCQLLSVAKITFEDHVALAHQVYIAAGGHDIRSATMVPKNEPITVKSGTWIASCAFIGPGVTVHENTVVGAAAVVMKDVGPNEVIAGNPGRVIRERVIDRP